MSRTTAHASTRAFRLAVRWLIGQEAVVLLAALAIVLALLAFSKTAGEMMEGDLREFDDGVLRMMRSADDPSVPIGPAWLVQVAIDVTALGGTGVLAIILLIVVGYLALEGRYDAIALIVVATAGGGFLSELLKWWFARKRPEIVPHLVNVGSASFPSGHSLLAVVTYLTLGAVLARFVPRRRSRTYCIVVSLLLALLIGLSRVYLGVHYPTDVLAGWSAGLAWALPCWLVARYLQYRGRVKPPS
jgi:undecaprenyl-diphosphatase